MISKQNKGKMKYLIISLLIISIVIPLVLSLNFSSGPIINGGSSVYTADNLDCTWTEAGDAYVPINVTWYKNNVPYLNMSTTGTNVSLHSANTTKAESWICEVQLGNQTDTLYQNASATIANSAPINVELSNGTQALPDLHAIYEDTEYTFYIQADDPDGDPMIAYEVSAGDGLCVDRDVGSPDSGEIACTATHSHLTGSAVEAPEPNQSLVSVSILARESGLLFSGGPFNFTILPVNDQAIFSGDTSNVSVAAGQQWIRIINGSDEELDVNYSFSMYTDINVAFPGIIIMDLVGNSSINLTFNTTDFAPTNSHIGNWTVFLNVTDNASYNATRPPTQINFSLEVTQTNAPPVFLTNFTVTQGNETQLFEAYIYANDSNSGDAITFNVTSPGAGYDSCDTVFPWTINTTNTSRFNGTGFINMTLTNNHTSCRYLNVTATDIYGGQSSIITFLNITNANDPPTVYETGTDGNISSETTRLFAPYTYQINASDPDALTYDINNTGTLTYIINDTARFDINSSTGVFNVTPLNELFLGNWTINVTVTDGTYNDSRIMSLEILNNSAPIINITNNNLIFNQSDSIVMNFSGTEQDNNSMNVYILNLTSFNVSIYTATDIFNNYSGGYNETIWEIDLTNGDARLANDNVGNHSIRINLSDEYNATSDTVSTAILNFTIHNENDAPFWDNDKDNLTDALSFGTVIVNQTFSKIFNATDFDLFFGVLTEENLTFSYVNASATLENISFTKISSTTANLSFISRQNGTNNITLQVTDAEGLVDTEIMSFSVLSASDPPTFQNITPHYNSTTNLTVESFSASSNFPLDSVNVSFPENSTVVFDAHATFDSAIPNNNMSYRWLVDGVVNTTIINVSPTVDSNLTYLFDFDTDGNHNVTLRVIDARLSFSDWVWFINITNVNRAPTVINRLDNLTVNFSTTYPNYFSYRNAQQRIYDADEDLNGDGIRSVDFGENSTLNIDVLNTAACSFASFYVSGDDFTIVPTATGLCNIWFNVTDDHNASYITEYVGLSIIGGTPNSGTETPSSSSGGSRTETTVVTVPFEEEVDVPLPIKIVAPENVEIYVNQSIEIPIVLENNWEDALLGVSINATLANNPNVTYEFTRTYFSSIPVGGSVQTILKLTNYRGEGPFEVEIFAMVSDPVVTDSASIFINSLEQTSEGEEVRTKVTFARDMLSENPECRELNDLLERAQVAMESLNYKESLNLVNAVINGCKFLMNQEELIRNETPSVIEVGFDFVTENADKIAIGAGILTAMTILAYAIVGVQKMMSENK